MPLILETMLLFLLAFAGGLAGGRLIWKRKAGRS
jgi:hypothetical protein